MMKTPLVLCILDGWGYRQEASQNAIALAKTPHWDDILARFPRSLLQASGTSVGLPEGQMGNSEVGHTCLGAGRVVWQDLPRIDRAFAEQSVEQIPLFQELVRRLKETGGACHLMGLLSPGGVHSHQNHLMGLIELLSTNGIPVKVHGFLDGRDTPPQSALGYLQTFFSFLARFPGCQIATLSGRYYAMDRDQRWERTEKAFNTILYGVTEDRRDSGEFENLNQTFSQSSGQGEIQDCLSEIQHYYAQGIGDEFIPPFALSSYQGIHDGDGLIMGNFRADRVRQLLSAFLSPDFSGFSRKTRPVFSTTAGLKAYSQDLVPFIPPFFPDLPVTHCLGEILSETGRTQVRIAETEKYAHVTFFLNGGREEPFLGEKRVLVPSPKVATYDLQPEMSAHEVTKHVLHYLNQETPDVIVVNYANPDMVGHTGDLKAAIYAVEVVDACLGRLLEGVLACGGTLMITADHGNVELMEDPESGKNHTAHTLNPVPFVVARYDLSSEDKILKDGTLADVAPTILTLLGVPIPKEMTGYSLFAERKNLASGVC